MPQEAARVTHIPINQIDRNPHNPRRLFDSEPMTVLRESISKLGVLVPVTVYERSSTDASRLNVTPYVLLDGERRWRIVKELGMETIPAIIVEEPSDVNNIVTMFHIHNVREGWQLMPTALKLQTLMQKLDTTSERELASITQLKISQIRRCKILLSYPEKYQNMMLAPVSDRFKADFFIELDRIRRPALAEEFPPWIKRGDETCIDLFIDKYRTRTIVNITEFRELAAAYRGALDHGKLDTFFEQLDRFLDNESMKIQEITIPGVDFHRESQEIMRSSNRLLNQLRNIDNEALVADESLVKLLHQLAKEIASRLSETLAIEARDELRS